ncbi:hypothetical protein C5167_011706 [Papaver somniferum]|uniref:Uncharacterized protein n=1 Tax=Papaver somniferum TaxID=3469 RepID=A0A4Y7K6P4_PAPSO|nr:hypothetical protein C5167_011706 [Papaver somniferum]
MNDQIDVWIMIDNKWSKHLKITAQMYFGHPIQTLQNGKILFDGGGNGLRSYDPNLERARDLKIHDFPDDALVEAYIETLVALNSGAYVGQ